MNARRSQQQAALVLAGVAGVGTLVLAGLSWLRYALQWSQAIPRGTPLLLLQLADNERLFRAVVYWIGGCNGILCLVALALALSASRPEGPG